MDKYAIYELNITTVAGSDWRQLFIGFPDEDEVLLAIAESLKVLADPLKEDRLLADRLLADTYANYSQLVREQRLPDKPKAHANGNATRVCTYAGVTVGYIKAFALGYACDTKGAQNDSC